MTVGQTDFPLSLQTITLGLFKAYTCHWRVSCGNLPVWFQYLEWRTQLRKKNAFSSHYPRK